MIENSNYFENDIRNTTALNASGLSAMDVSDDLVTMVVRDGVGDRAWAGSDGRHAEALSLTHLQCGDGCVLETAFYEALLVTWTQKVLIANNLHDLFLSMKRCFLLLYNGR